MDDHILSMLLSFLGYSCAFILLSKIQIAMNRKIVKRGDGNYRLILNPPLALAYCIGLHIFAAVYFFGLMKSEAFSPWAQFLEGLNNRLGSVLEPSALINAYEVQAWANNIVFFLLFLIIKRQKILKISEIIEIPINIFRLERLFVFVKKDQSWELERKYNRVSKYINVLIFGAYVILWIYFSVVFGDWPEGFNENLGKNAISICCFPVAWLIILNECKCLMEVKDSDRNSEEEKRKKAEKRTGGENGEAAPKKMDMGRLQKLLKENSYGDLKKIDPPTPKKPTGYAAAGTSAEPENRVLLHEEKILKKYFQARGEAPNVYERELIPSVIQLLQKKSVVFSVMDFRTLGFAVSLPIWKEMLQNRRVLLICRQEEKHEVLWWIQTELEKVTNIQGLWNCGILAETKEDVQIGIMSLEDIEADERIADLKAYFKHVTQVVMLNPVFFITRGCRSLSFLVDELEAENVNYIICGSYRNSTIDSLSTILKTDMTIMKTFLREAEETMIVFWDADGTKKPGKLPLPEILLPDIAIGIDMVKSGADRICFYGEDVRPEKDLAWQMESYRGRLSKEIRKSALEEVFIFDRAVDSRTYECHYMLTEDRHYNICETARQAAMKGRTQVCAHIFSPHYMLRNFLYELYDVLKDLPGAIPQYMPVYMDSERNQVLHLIRRMTRSHVSERVIRESITVDKEKDLKSELENKIKTYLGKEAEPVFDVREQTEFSTETNSYQTVLWYKLDDPEKKLNDYWDTNRIVYLGENQEKQRGIGSTSGNFVHQNYLPGQKTVINGKYYEIQSVETNGLEHIVKVRRIASSYQGRLYYRQVRRFELEEVSMNQEVSSFGSQVVIESGTANIKAETIGFFESSTLRDLSHGIYTKYQKTETRCYGKKKYLVLRFNGISVRTRDTIGLLLNELFYSLFPDSCSYLSIGIEAASKKSQKSAYIRILSDVIQLDSDAKNGMLYIFEDSQDDIGMLEIISRNLGVILELMHSYIKWELEASGQSPYITYGYEDECEKVSEDIKKVKEYLEGIKIKPLLLEKVENKKKEESGGAVRFSDHMVDEPLCDYCGAAGKHLRPGKGGSICEDCENSMLVSKEQAIQIKNHVIEELIGNQYLKPDFEADWIRVTGETGEEIDIDQKLCFIRFDSLFKYKICADKLCAVLRWKLPEKTYTGLVVYTACLLAGLKTEDWTDMNVPKRLLDKKAAAKWMSLKFLYFHGNVEQAKREDSILRQGDDDFSIQYQETVEQKGFPWEL